MSVERRVIVGAADRERTAIVSIPIPAGGEVEIDRAWRFLGWRAGLPLPPVTESVLVEVPQRIVVQPDTRTDQ